MLAKPGATENFAKDAANNREKIKKRSWNDAVAMTNFVSVFP